LSLEKGLRNFSWQSLQRVWKFDSESFQRKRCLPGVHFIREMVGASMMDVYMTKQAFCSGESVVMPKSLFARKSPRIRGTAGLAALHRVDVGKPKANN